MMSIAVGRTVTFGTAREVVFAQGTIEKAFPLGEEACTERVRYAKAESGRQSDDGFALKRGLLTGALAEAELANIATDRGMTVDLGEAADKILTKTRLGGLPLERVEELRSAAIGWVRDWQSRFPPEDGDLDWMDVEHLLAPQYEFLVRRPGRFGIKVRPDNVVGVGTTLVAVEWSTAKDPASISPARIALNHHALLRDRLRRPEWASYQAIATRVEMLALGSGYTVRLSLEEAERWRVTIGQVAEALTEGRFEKHRSAHCSTCFWRPECWFGDDQGDSF